MRTRIYVASKAVHGPKWKALRAEGLPIISTWIDESGQGQTVDWADLWDRCVREAANADWCLVYAEPGEILKGALVEMGAALASHARVLYVGPPDILSALRHRAVRHVGNLDEAIAILRAAYGKLSPCAGRCGQLEDPRWGGFCDGCAP